MGDCHRTNLSKPAHHKARFCLCRLSKRTIDNGIETLRISSHDRLPQQIHTYVTDIQARSLWGNDAVAILLLHVRSYRVGRSVSLDSSSISNRYVHAGTKPELQSSSFLLWHIAFQGADCVARSISEYVWIESLSLPVHIIEYWKEQKKLLTAPPTDVDAIGVYLYHILVRYTVDNHRYIFVQSKQHIWVHVDHSKYRKAVSVKHE